MREDDRIRLRHMLDAASEALAFAANRNRRDLDTDRMLVLALVKSVEIIGEAGARVSEAGRDATPDVPWPEIVAMRNRLVHTYFDVNLDVVWETVRNDLPALVTALQDALGDRETDQQG
jgi:uncharacterized protein with HEPN domain